MSAFVTDISFAIDEVGFVAGSGGIFKTTAKGDTWNLNYTTSFIIAGNQPHSDNGFTAIALDGPDLGISAGFQNKNMALSIDDFINEKAYIARTTTLGE